MCPNKGRGNRVGVVQHPDNRTLGWSTWFFASGPFRCIGHLVGLDCDCVKSCSGKMRLGRKRTPSHGGPTRPGRRKPPEGLPPQVDNAVAVAVAVAVAARFVCEGDVHSDLSVNERGGSDTL